MTAPDVAAFLLARVRDRENAIESEAEDHAPLFEDPKVLLAECAAIRAVVEYLAGSLPRVLKLLAAPYAAHPDFDPAWARVDG